MLIACIIIILGGGVFNLAICKKINKQRRVYLFSSKVSNNTKKREMPERSERSELPKRLETPDTANDLPYKHLSHQETAVEMVNTNWGWFIYLE